MNNEKKEFKRLTPFKMQVLQSFPFIDADFDAITNYELLCKVVEYLNTTVDNVNLLEDNYVILYNYVHDFFDNLDVQDEVNNKLDQMVEDGELASILSNYLLLEKNYDTLSQMISDETLLNGQKVRVNGKNTLNDGGGGYYIINTTTGIVLSNGLKAKVIDNFLENYYNFTPIKERINDTDCYTVLVPMEDSLGNAITPVVNYHPNENPIEYADKEYTSLTINASIAYQSDYSEYPIIISNEELLGNNYNGTIPDYCYYLGFKDNRVLKTYSKDTSYASMIADGVKQAFLTFGKLVDNGDEVEATYGNALVKNPRVAIGLLSDNTMLIFACDGRIGNNAGLTCHELAEILIDKGCVTAWNIDGGGSTSLILNGTKINRNIDGNGTKERNIHCTLNFKRETKFKAIANAFSKIGSVKQDIISEVFGDFINNNGTDISNSDLDDLIGNVIVGYGNNLTNSFRNNAGYFINIPHAVEAYKNLYNIQLFSTRDRNYIYMRKQVNGVFGLWEVVSATNKKSFVTTSDYAISTSGSYVKIKLAEGQNQTDVIAPVSPQPSNDYTTIAIKRVGYATIKLCVELEVSTSPTNTRYFRIYKGNNTLATVSLNTTTGRNLVNYEYFFNNDSADNEYTIAYNGVSGDSFRQCTVIIETN